MKIEKINGERDNNTRNIYEYNSYFSDFTDYNKISNQVEKVDKGTSTIIFKNNNTSRDNSKLKYEKMKKINEILSQGERKQYKSLFNRKNKDFKYLSDNYINNMLDSQEIEKNKKIFLPVLGKKSSINSINSMNNFELKNSKIYSISEDKKNSKNYPSFINVKYAKNFNEKLDLMDIDYCPSITPKNNFKRLKLLMNKQYEKNKQLLLKIKRK